MIIIAYNHEGLPISIVKAKSEDAAMAYWQGQDNLPHRHEVLDSTEPAEGTLINPILQTQKKNFGDAFNRREALIVIK